MRHTLLVLILSLCSGLTASRSALAFGEAAEAEAARHHARAGGPTNDRDRDLLTVYGCFAPSNNAFCSRLAGQHLQSGPRYRRRPQ